MTEFHHTETSASGTPPGGAVAASVLREAEAWTTAQCEFLSGMAAIWTDWFRRWRDSVDASARSFQRMLECRNPADLAQLQQQWLADAAQRNAADLGNLASESVALTWRVVGADRRAARQPSPPARTTGSAARPKSGEDAALQHAAE
jgi:phasin protein